jgi:phosphoesterase RecJ-like protein
MAAYLRKLGHTATVVTPTDYPEFLNWMAGHKETVIYQPRRNEKEVKKHFETAEVIFCLDFATLARINELGPMVAEAKAVKVQIDHHLQPEPFADIVFSDTTAAATAELVYDLIKNLGHQNLIDKQMGECLYAGIMTDTGSFKHPSTSANVHLITANLLGIGVNTADIHRLIYDSYSLKRLRFLGYILKDKLVVLPKFNTAYIAISADELKEYDSKTGDTEGLVNFALSVEGIVFAAIIIDRGVSVKISFRSVGEFSVNEFARKHFDGGGHRNASGGMSELPLEDTVAKFEGLLPLYREQLVPQLTETQISNS